MMKLIDLFMFFVFILLSIGFENPWFLIGCVVLGVPPLAEYIEREHEKSLEKQKDRELRRIKRMRLTREIEELKRKK